jgi:hypothetical protein
MARKNGPTVPEVPLDLWRELYQVAASFGLLAPWRWMNDQHLLGINNEHGIRLLSVMGGMGEVFGLASYQGSDGANFLLRLLRGDFPPETQEAVYYQDALLVDFVPGKELRKRDRLIMDRLQFQPAASRPRLFPKFTRYKPGYLPWFIDEAEARSLLDDLLNEVRFAGLLRTNPGSWNLRHENEVPFFPASASDPLTLAQFEWHTLSPVPPAADPLIEPQTLDLAPLLNLPQAPGAAWELTAFFSHMSISGGSRPYWPKMALGVDGRTGMVLAFELGTPEKTMAGVAARALEKSVQAARGRPAAIKVDSVNLFRALQPLAAALEVKLIQAKGQSDNREYSY